MRCVMEERRPKWQDVGRDAEVCRYIEMFPRWSRVRQLHERGSPSGVWSRDPRRVRVVALVGQVVVVEGFADCLHAKISRAAVCGFAVQLSRLGKTSPVSSLAPIALTAVSGVASPESWAQRLPWTSAQTGCPTRTCASARHVEQFRIGGSDGLGAREPKLNGAPMLQKTRGDHSDIRLGPGSYRCRRRHA
jgi:hypothetical protein